MEINEVKKEKEEFEESLKRTLIPTHNSQQINEKAIKALKRIKQKLKGS